jgi:hypothetical protein
MIIHAFSGGGGTVPNFEYLRPFWLDILDHWRILLYNIFGKLYKYNAIAYLGVGIATGWKTRVWFPTVHDFSLLYSVQTGSGAHPAFYPMGIGGSYTGGKAGGAWSQSERGRGRLVFVVAFTPLSKWYVWVVHENEFSCAILTWKLRISFQSKFQKISTESNS